MRCENCEKTLTPAEIEEMHDIRLGYCSECGHQTYEDMSLASRHWRDYKGDC